MITPELLDFIEAELKAGQSQEGLTRLLHEGGGWTEIDIHEALAALEKRGRPVSIAQMRAEGSPQSISMVPPPLAPAPKVEVKKEPAARVGEILHPVPPAATSVAFHPPPPSPLVPALSPSPITTAEKGSSIPAPLTEGTPVVESPQAGKHLGVSLRLPTSSTQRIMVLGGLVLLLALFGIGAFFLIRSGAPNDEKVFATMHASIPGIQSFRYSGETTLSFSGKVTDPLKADFPEGYTGSAKIALKYLGRTDLSKGIDGTHQFGVTADLRSGESALTVNSSIELRIIGDTYYLKITNPPEIKDIDLSRLNTYWIAIAPADIVKRFGGVVPDEKDTYGSFSGTATVTPTVRGIIASNPLFSSYEKIGEEQLGGAQTIHYRFVGHPDNILALLRFIVGEVTGSPWDMSEEEAVNVKALIKNVSGDIWIDAVSYLPRKIVFRQPLKGTVSGIALDGTLDVEQNFSEYNGSVAVSTPRPVITYDEFAEDVRRQSERVKATGDARRVFDAEDIVSALEVYRANHDNTYPLLLDDLVTSGILSRVPTDPDAGTYIYTPLLGKGRTTKKSLCTSATSTCAYFHLGITLATTTAEVLKTDSDLVTEMFSGADTKGCAKEVGKACYDLTPKTPQN